MVDNEVVQTSLVRFNERTVNRLQSMLRLRNVQQQVQSEVYILMEPTTALYDHDNDVLNHEP